MWRFILVDLGPIIELLIMLLHHLFDLVRYAPLVDVEVCHLLLLGSPCQREVEREALDEELLQVLWLATSVLGITFAIEVLAYTGLHHLLHEPT